MTNSEYLGKMKKKDEERAKVRSLRREIGGWEIEYRKVKALEIIAEELCIMNDPSVGVTMLKPKIQLSTKEKRGNDQGEIRK